MLSYSLGSLKIDQVDILDTQGSLDRQTKGTGIFKFIKKREIPVIKELEKYGSDKISSDLIDRLTNVLEKNNFKVRILVAADYWFRGNGNPNVFTPDMFTSDNIPFLNVIRYGYDGKLLDYNALTTFTIYANYLKNYVYSELTGLPVLDLDELDEDFQIYEDIESD